MPTNNLTNMIQGRVTSGAFTGPVTGSRTLGSGAGAGSSPIYDAMGNFSGYSTESVDPTAPPPKADSAPKTDKRSVFTGLCEALNTYEKNLVPTKFDFPNVYKIEFAPPELGQAVVLRPGKEKDTSPMSSANSAGTQLDKNRQSFDTTARTLTFNAGQPIVQILDSIMRNSSYISDQATYKVDEVTKATIPQSPLGGMTWYKINVKTVPLQFDEKRGDFAYEITYTISAYGVNYILSEYFPNGNFRGFHKSYNYWFTGENTEIIGFEQEYNKLYKQIISNPEIPISSILRSNEREVVPRVMQSANEQSRQGAKGRTNDIGADAASSFYSPGDQAKIKLRLVGDPAWLQQGEVATGVDGKTFDFAPFNTDGTINFDASEIAFDISWNRGVDYDLNTGLADSGAGNYQANREGGNAGKGKENAVYRAIKCKSFFNRGRFEQELDGRLFLIKPPETSKGGLIAGANGSTSKNTGANIAAGAAGGTFNTPAARMLQNKEANAGFPYKEPAPTPLAQTAVAQLNETLSPKALLPSVNKPATTDGQPTTFAQSIQQNQATQNQRLQSAISQTIANNPPQKIVKDQ